MCDSGVSLTSCTEDAGLDTSDCDSPTGKGGHTVTIQVSFIAKTKAETIQRSTKKCLRSFKFAGQGRDPEVQIIIDFIICV